jgi:D-threo-aldose 1-dehydrogenase
LQRRKISVIAGGVFNSGILAVGARARAPTYDYRGAPSDIIERVRKIEEICGRHHVALSAAAAQFVYAHPAVSTVLLGAEKPRRWSKMSPRSQPGSRKRSGES